MRVDGGKFGIRTNKTLKWCFVCKKASLSSEVVINSIPPHFETMKENQFRNSLMIPVSISLNRRKRWRLLSLIPINSYQKKFVFSHFQFPRYPYSTRRGVLPNKKKRRPTFLYRIVPSTVTVKEELIKGVLFQSDWLQMKEQRFPLRGRTTESSEWVLYRYEEDSTFGSHAYHGCMDHALGDTSRDWSSESGEPIGWRPTVHKTAGLRNDQNYMFIHCPNHKKKGRYFNCQSGRAGQRRCHHEDRMMRKQYSGPSPKPRKLVHSYRKSSRCHMSKINIHDFIY